jgi:hypothetical protein
MSRYKTNLQDIVSFEAIFNCKWPDGLRLPDTYDAYEIGEVGWGDFRVDMAWHDGKGHLVCHVTAFLNKRGPRFRVDGGSVYDRFDRTDKALECVRAIVGSVNVDGEA